MEADITFRAEEGVVTGTSIKDHDVHIVTREQLASLPVGQGYLRYDGKVVLFQSPLLELTKPFDESMEVLEVREDTIFKREVVEPETVKKVEAPMPP